MTIATANHVEDLSDRIINSDSNWQVIFGSLGERPAWFFNLMGRALALAQAAEIEYVTSRVNYEASPAEGRVVLLTSARLIDISFTASTDTLPAEITASAFPQSQIRHIQISDLKLDRDLLPRRQGLSYEVHLDSGRVVPIPLSRFATTVEHPEAEVLSRLLQRFDA